MKTAKVEILDSDKIQLREFRGWLGPMWSIIFYCVEHRRKVKELNAIVAVHEAEAKLQQGEFNQQLKIAETKVKAIRENCLAGVHEVTKWRTGTGWTNTNRITRQVTAKWHDMHGLCIHCGTPVTTKAYEFKHD